jgi:hypothetical protein
LNRRVKRLERSNEVQREREPQRLLQVEAMRGQVTKYVTAKGKGNNANLMEVKQTLPNLLTGYLKDLEMDKKDGLSSDVIETWKQAALDITKDALEYLDHFGVDPASRPDDALGPLRKAIGKVAALTEAVAKGVQEPDEEGLRDLTRKLGTVKKEIMGISRGLVVGQSASLATEAHELTSKAREAIRASREMIKAALRGMGAASDILEASGPSGAPRLPAPCETRTRKSGRSMGAEESAGDPSMASTEYANHDYMAPTEMPPRSTTGGAGDELAALMRGLMGAQANDNGWPTFNGKYVEYPRFRKEWWAYRQTYHRHVRDELVCRSLKERSLASSVKVLVNNIDDLREAWSTLDTCFDRPEKYIAEALDPIIKFRSYKAFDNGAIREYYSLLRAAMMGARKAGLLHRLVNDQTLPSILAKMPPSDWRQWARERPTWMREAIEEAFWSFVDQKWRDALNAAAAEPPVGARGAGKEPPTKGTGRGWRKPRNWLRHRCT